jgi:hypothetical protein
MAFNPGYKVVGELFQQWQQLTGQFAGATAADRDFIRLMTASAQLAALDRQSLVILGDPTVALPPLSNRIANEFGITCTECDFLRSRCRTIWCWVGDRHRVIENAERRRP